MRDEGTLKLECRCLISHTECKFVLGLQVRSSDACAALNSYCRNSLTRYLRQQRCCSQQCNAARACTTSPYGADTMTASFTHGLRTSRVSQTNSQAISCPRSQRNCRMQVLEAVQQSRQRSAGPSADCALDCSVTVTVSLPLLAAQRTYDMHLTSQCGCASTGWRCLAYQLHSTAPLQFCSHKLNKGKVSLIHSYMLCEACIVVLLQVQPCLTLFRCNPSGHHL